MRVEKYSSDCYHLILSDARRKLTIKEAEDLFYSLLTTLPNVPERIKTLWEMRCAITCEVTKWYYFDEPTGTTVERYTGAIKQGNELLYSGINCVSITGAVIDAYLGYGMPGPDKFYIKEDLVSKKTAEEKSIIYQATKYCEENGITLNQLLSQAISK